MILDKRRFFPFFFCIYFQSIRQSDSLPDSQSAGIDSRINSYTTYEENWKSIETNHNILQRNPYLYIKVFPAWAAERLNIPTNISIDSFFCMGFYRVYFKWKNSQNYDFGRIWLCFSNMKILEPKLSLQQPLQLVILVGGIDPIRRIPLYLVF